MPIGCRFILLIIIRDILISSESDAKNTLIRSANRLAPPQSADRLTLEDAKQRALTTSKGLQLAHLGIDEKREVTAAARTDYLPKLIGSVNYFHFNSNLGVVETLRTGQHGILPVGTRSIAVNAVNQDYFSLDSDNFCWPVQTLRIRSAEETWQPRTPAMAAGLADLVWSLAEWLRFPVVKRAWNTTNLSIFLG